MNIEYDRDKAGLFILEKLSGDYRQLSAEDLKSFIRDAAAEDENYMREMGFLSDDESDEDMIYDEEDAFNFILSGLDSRMPYKKWKDDLIEDLIDDYLEYKYEFLVAEGLAE